MLFLAYQDVDPDFKMISLFVDRNYCANTLGFFTTSTWALLEYLSCFLDLRHFEANQALLSILLKFLVFPAPFCSIPRETFLKVSIFSNIHNNLLLVEKK